jgi:hypothetical protein
MKYGSALKSLDGFTMILVSTYLGHTFVSIKSTLGQKLDGAFKVSSRLLRSMPNGVWVPVPVISRDAHSLSTSLFMTF